MKTISTKEHTSGIKKIIPLFLLLIALCNLTGCENNPYYDETYEATEKLCGNDKWWISEFYEDKRLCTQEFRFGRDGYGEEYFTYYYPNGTIDKQYHDYFRWDWASPYADVIHINYENGDYSDLESLQLGWSRFTGYLNGTFVEFQVAR